jgi:hypothetical protein
MRGASRSIGNIRPEYYWFGIFAFFFGLFEFITSFIRPGYQGSSALIRYLLGIAPNFLPAIGLPALFILFMISVRSDGNPGKWMGAHKQVTALSISTGGLIIWEFLQLKGALVFDWHDILWTFNGAGIFLFIWRLSPERMKSGYKA